jgi:hypothetical protein
MISSNKKPFPPKSGSVCDQEPYHPGCPQIVNPEEYCTCIPNICETGTLMTGPMSVKECYDVYFTNQEAISSGGFGEPGDLRYDLTDRIYFWVMDTFPVNEML